MLGIVSKPQVAGRVGMVVVVGGPQYRVGSHRQFLKLAHRLAGEGHGVLRFDYRGMGDSEGEARSFESIGEDIDVAVQTLQRVCPTVEKVVLWGLCDGASAALLYCATHDAARLAGLCLLNPWVRSDGTLARMRLKRYYGGRLLESEFWRSLWRGGVVWHRSLIAFWQDVMASWQPVPVGVQEGEPFQNKMAQAMRAFPGPILLILSGCDFTAKEFLECASTNPHWEGLLNRPAVSRVDVADADHTFSRADWRDAAEQAVLKWLQNIG